MLFILNTILFSLLINSFLLILFKTKINTFNCGIWAFHGNPKHFSKDKFNILGLFNESRGGDACGVASNGYHKTFSDTFFRNYFEAIPNFIDLPISNYYLGHTRATSANNLVSKYKNEYSQPFKLLNSSSVGVHNGTLYNNDELLAKYPVPKNFKLGKETFSPNDSQILLYTLLYIKDLSILTEYEGAAATIWFDETTKTLNFYHGKSLASANRLEEERPLFILKSNKDKFIWLSSIKESLEALCIPDSVIEEVPHNILFTYKDGVEINQTLFDREKCKQTKTYYSAYTNNHYKRVSVNTPSNFHFGKYCDDWIEDQFSLDFNNTIPKETKNTSFTLNTKTNFTTKTNVQNDVINKVLFIYGQYKIKETEMHGRYLLNKSGEVYNRKFHKRVKKSFNNYYFYNGYMINSPDNYEKLRLYIKEFRENNPTETLDNFDIKNLDIQILTFIALYSKTPVNIHGNSSVRRWVVYKENSEVVEDADLEIVPEFSNMKFVFKRGKISEILLAEKKVKENTEIKKLDPKIINEIENMLFDVSDHTDKTLDFLKKQNSDDDIIIGYLELLNKITEILDTDIKIEK